MKKIDWKQVAKSPGYISLKEAYIKNVQENQLYINRGQRPMRDKAEFLRHFKWVIGRAMYYAHKYDCSITSVLYEWESRRDYWWLNFYQDSRQPKSKKSVS